MGPCDCSESCLVLHGEQVGVVSMLVADVLFPRELPPQALIYLTSFSSGLSGLTEIAENDNYTVYSQAQTEQTRNDTLCRKNCSPFTHQNRRLLCPPPCHSFEFHPGMNFPSPSCSCLSLACRARCPALCSLVWGRIELSLDMSFCCLQTESHPVKLAGLGLTVQSRQAPSASAIFLPALAFPALTLQA